MAQKKEMFRTELKNRTLSSVTRSLADKETRRQKALGDSVLELESDKKNVIEFVQESNAKRKEKERMEQELMRKKALKEEALRLLDNDINAVTAEISKTQDTVASFQLYKEFMMILTPQEDRMVFEIDREQRYQNLKEEWCSRVKNDTWMDYIIFHDDELLGDDNPKLT